MKYLLLSLFAVGNICAMNNDAQEYYKNKKYHEDKRKRDYVKEQKKKNPNHKNVRREDKLRKQGKQ